MIIAQLSAIIFPNYLCLAYCYFNSTFPSFKHFILHFQYITNTILLIIIFIIAEGRSCMSDHRSRIRYHLQVLTKLLCLLQMEN